MLQFYKASLHWVLAVKRWVIITLIVIAVVVRAHCIIGVGMFIADVPSRNEGVSQHSMCVLGFEIS